MKKRDVVKIDISVEDYNDIFNSMDYGTLKRRSLNTTLEGYVYDSVIWYDLKTPMEIIFHVNEDVKEKMKDTIEHAFREHFQQRAGDVMRKNRLEMKIWGRNACIGVLFLLINLYFISVVNRSEMQFLVEIFSIVGSVSLWEPVSYILYGWQEGRKNQRYFKKMSELPIFFEYKTEVDKKREKLLDE